MIDVDAGGVVTGDMTIEQAGENLLDTAIRVASGERSTKAEQLGQDDFITWKRGVFL